MSILQFPHSSNPDNVKEIADQILALSGELLQKPVSHTKKQSIFHQQLLKSSLFSARIEGNTLTLAQSKEIDLKNPKQKTDLEISNVLKCLNNLHKLPAKLSLKSITSIHKQVMDKIDHGAGQLRSESSAIFDGLGNVVYLTPEPKDMMQMLDLLLQNHNKKLESTKQLIKSAECHYYYEKIHPFIDGNGRSGRVLLQHQLQKSSLFASYILPVDEYFEKNRSQYYFHLEKNTRDIEPFVKFFLDGVVFSLKKLLQDIDNISHNSSDTVVSLLPRRHELVEIIKDHPYISLDSLCRRFPTIPRRTMAYDVNWLVKNNHITKHGSTNGVRYSKLSE